MYRPQRTAGLVSNLALAVLLVTAQAGAVLHAFEHDFGALQNNACSTCATASQLASACVDSHVAAEIDAPGTVLVATTGAGLQSVHAGTARQRGPPHSL